MLGCSGGPRAGWASTGAHTGGGRRQGALSAGEAHARALQRALCAREGALGERRGRLGQPSSLGVADHSQGQSGRYLGPRAPWGWCLALGHARTRHC